MSNWEACLRVEEGQKTNWKFPSFGSLKYFIEGATKGTPGPVDVCVFFMMTGVVGVFVFFFFSSV